MKNYLIIMPAYNEAKNIDFLLSNMSAYKESTVIINDGSTDHTGDIIHKHGFECINNSRNFGVAESIALGVEYALNNNIEKIILMDSDGQHNPKYIPAFLRQLRQHDFVFGCRYYKSEFAPTNKWASNLFAAALYAELTGRFFSDISCGFKGVHISEGLVRTIKNSKGYGVIYDIVNYALSTHADIAITPIDAIYFYDEFLYTRLKEIIDLLNSVDNFRKTCKLNDSFKSEQTIRTVRHAIKYHEEFHVNVANVDFWAYPVRDDGFLFQINPMDILTWIEKCGYF